MCGLLLKAMRLLRLLQLQMAIAMDYFIISTIQNMDLNVLLSFKNDFVSRIIDRFLMITLQLVLLLDIKINNTTTTVQ